MRLRFNNIQERIKGTFLETLDITILEDDDSETLIGRMPVYQAYSQTMGVLHGGVTIALAETVSGVGSNNICAENERCYGMQISASHISSAHIGDTVVATARLQHKGQMTHVWDVDVVSETTRKLISTVRITNAVLKQK